MTEPQRLLEQGATDAERALLQSARADRPPEGASERALIAIEALSASGGAGAAAAAHAIKLSVLTKVGWVALVGLGALGVAVLGLRSSGQPSPASENPATPAPAVQAQPAAAPVEIPTVPAIPAPAAAPEAVPTPPASATGPKHRQTAATDESLSAELRLLDVARAAVDARNPTAAQRALDNHAQRFPQGHLKPEATVLRLAVLVQQGNRAAAKSLAAQLLASGSYKAYEYRIRSLLREME
jgi:TolA-binding protein